jgi:hypothetical protein
VDPYLCIGLRADHRGMLLGVLLLGGGKWLRIELCGRGLEIFINGKRAYEAIVFYLERLALKIAGKSSQRLRSIWRGVTSVPASRDAPCHETNL